jgi:hypothetical protein
MRFEGSGFQFLVILHADEPGMVLELDDFHHQAVGLHADKTEPGFFLPFAVIDIDIAAVPVAF